MKFAYYPGCSLHATAKEYDLSVVAVCAKLGVELVELEDWNCCGATAAYSTSHLLSIALPARNLASAEKMGMDIMAPCSACFHKLSKANISLKEKPELRDKINKIMESTGLKYRGTREVRHPADIIINEVGLDRIRENVERPLTGLKVAPYYGCLLVRPKRVARFDDPENPRSLDDLITAIGADPVKYYYKAKCCGGPIMMTREDVALELTRDILRSAKESGARCIITACPLCQMLLDVKQRAIEEHFDVDINLPILYFTQLLGLALGIEPKVLGIDKNMISPAKLVETF